MLMKKQQHELQNLSIVNNPTDNDNDDDDDEDDDDDDEDEEDDEDQNEDQHEDENNDENMLNDKNFKDNENSSSKNIMNEVFKFIQEKFLPLLKRTFESMMNYIEHYRAMSIKIDSELYTCFAHWREQIGNQESICQTLFSHYQSLIIFILILRDNLHNCNFDSMQNFGNLIDNDHWYLHYYYRLCDFHNVLPKPNINDQQQSELKFPFNLQKDEPNELLKDSLLMEQSTHSIMTKINLIDLGKNNSISGSSSSSLDSNTAIINTNPIMNPILFNQQQQQQQQQNFIGRYQVTTQASSDTNFKSTLLPQTPSILQQHLQQASTNQLNDLNLSSNNDFSIGSTQYSFNSSTLNHMDIFGFTRQKPIECKKILVALVPVKQFINIKLN